MGLTRLILVYMQKLGGLAEPIFGTSIQLTKRLRSKVHVDRKNQGESWIVGVGSWTGGETFFYDKDSLGSRKLTEDIARIGPKGTLLPGETQQIDGTIDSPVQCIK